MCVRYASWHISEKRSPLEVYSASCTYIDGSKRERERERRGPSSSQCVRHWKKGRKGWLSLPPRLVGANEGGTDRPVCTLPLSGSCRASTPNRIHVALRSLCATPCLSLSLSLSLFLSHHLLRNSADREVGVLCSG